MLSQTLSPKRSARLHQLSRADGMLLSKNTEEPGVLSGHQQTSKSQEIKKSNFPSGQQCFISGATSAVALRDPVLAIRRLHLLVLQVIPMLDRFSSRENADDRSFGMRIRSCTPAYWCYRPIMHGRY